MAPPAPPAAAAAAQDPSAAAAAAKQQEQQPEPEPKQLDMLYPLHALLCGGGGGGGGDGRSVMSAADRAARVDALLGRRGGGCGGDEELTQQRDEWGELPLHVAAANPSAAEHVAALLAAFPDAAKLRSGWGVNQGDLPFHLALANGAPAVSKTGRPAQLTNLPRPPDWSAPPGRPFSTACPGAAPGSLPSRDHAV